MTDLIRDEETGSYVHPDDPGEPQTGHGRLSITDVEAKFLAALVAGREVLEIGTGLGVSTRALASTAKRVVTIDIDPWVRSNIWPTLPDNVEGTEKLRQNEYFDAVFIDADHSTEAVRADMAFARQWLKSGAVVILHDVNYANVAGAVDTFPEEFVTINTMHGLGVCWT